MNKEHRKVFLFYVEFEYAMSLYILIIDNTFDFIIGNQNILLNIL